MKNSKLNPNFLEITSIIDTDVFKDTASYYESINRAIPSNFVNKVYEAGMILVTLTTYREREFTPAISSEVEGALAGMNALDRALMEGRMALKGQTANADFSIGKNSTMYSIEKVLTKLALGIEYNAKTFSTLIGSNANEVFPTFAANPYRVRNEELLENVCKLLGGAVNPKTGLPFGWSHKTAGANGAVLTKGGKNICRRTVLTSLKGDLEDFFIQHEQDLSIKNRPAVSAVEKLVA